MIRPESLPLTRAALPLSYEPTRHKLRDVSRRARKALALPAACGCKVRRRISAACPGKNGAQLGDLLVGRGAVGVFGDHRLQKAGEHPLGGDQRVRRLDRGFSCRRWRRTGHTGAGRPPRGPGRAPGSGRLPKVPARLSVRHCSSIRRIASARTSRAQATSEAADGSSLSRGSSCSARPPARRPCSRRRVTLLGGRRAVFVHHVPVQPRSSRKVRNRPRLRSAREMRLLLEDLVRREPAQQVAGLVGRDPLLDHQPGAQRGHVAFQQAPAHGGGRPGPRPTPPRSRSTTFPERVPTADQNHPSPWTEVYRIRPPPPESP